MRRRELTTVRLHGTWGIMLVLAGMIVRPAHAEVVSGEVTYAASRSVYVQLDNGVMPASGDSVYAGVSENELEQSEVRAISGDKVVLERASSLTGAEAGTVVYLNLPSRRMEAVASTGESNNEASRLSIPRTGRFALQYYRYRGDSGGIEYDQPAAYLDLTTGGGPASPLEISFRFRTRLQRELAMPDGRDMTDERTDRLYDLAATYHAERYTVTVGRTRRIGDAGMGGMGGLDGILGEYRFSDGFSGGMFAGTAPELDNFIGDHRETKNGMYLVWSHDGDRSFESAAAFIHRRESGGLATGTLYLGQQSRFGRQFRIAGETVMIVSRDGTGNTVGPEDETLQNARAHMSWTVSRRLRLSVNYSGYLVREYRDLDAPFDPLDAVRYEHAHTVLSRGEISLPAAVTISGEALAGVNPSQGDGLLSAAVRGRAANILHTGIASMLSVVQTEQGIGTGRHLLATVSRTQYRLQCSLSGGITSYERPHMDDTLTQRMRVSLYYMPGRSYYGSLQMTRSWGERIMANTFFMELGTRFGTNAR